MERILSKLEFKRKLRLAKDQLFSDIFKKDDFQFSEIFTMDELSDIEVRIRNDLKELKKRIYCDTSKYDLKDLERNVEENFNEKEKKLNRLVLVKYRDAIKSLNDKLIYLKTDLDAFKGAFGQQDLLVKKQFYNESKNNFVRLDSSIKDVEKSLESKIDSILENKDKNLNKQIDYLIKNNDKISSEKMGIIRSLQEKNESFMKDSMTKIYDLVKQKDIILEEKSNLILEQREKIAELEKKLSEYNSTIEKRINENLISKKDLEKQISLLQKHIKSQNIKTTFMFFIFIGILVLMFVILEKASILEYLL
ncbi:MAG TPA: hypothetical protein VJ892_02210 [Candidatus Absconditabacterales bacterium]|nr:hypothetical protein [Candidatus Absconditabacterales bacterium]